MKLYPTENFKKQYKKLPETIKERTKKQFAILLNDTQHPSLGIKKMRGKKDIWEGRISDDYRFTFKIEEEFYILRTIGTHDILKHP